MKPITTEFENLFTLPTHASGLGKSASLAERQLNFAVFRMLSENLGLKNSDFVCEDFAPDSSDRSFYAALFAHHSASKQYWLLASKFTNFWACAASDGSLPDFTHTFFRFLDLPELTERLQSVKVLPAVFLNRKIDSEDALSQAAVKELSDEEFAFFSHHQPERLGDVLFHAWL